MVESLPFVTVAIPLFNEARLVDGLLAAVLAQVYPPSQMQVLLVDGGSNDGTAAMLAQAAASHPHFTLLHNPGRTAAAGLNLALAHASGQYLIRLDARTRPAPDYVRRCVELLQTGEWAGVAGPQIAAGETPAGRAHALALNHAFGSGRPRYRRPGWSGESETLYLGAYPLAWLRSVGGWDVRFAANEDFDLHTRLRRAGGRLWIDSRIRSVYLARDSLWAMARQYGRYGTWRAASWRKHPGAMHGRHLIPAGFVALLLFSLALAPFWPWLLAALAGIYLGLVLAVSLQLSIRHGFGHLPRLLLTFPALHLAWGFAFWLAMLIGSYDSMRSDRLGRLA